MTRVQTVGLPSDAMYQSNAQSMAAEVAKLAFQSAQAEAALIPAASPPSGGNASSSQQNLAKLQSDVNARISALEAQISTLNQQISGARKAQLQDLMAQKERAQGELDLSKAMHQTFEQMSQFMTTNGDSGTGGLEGSINELRRSVPELTTSGSKTAVKPPSTPVAMPASTGLIGEVVQLYEQLQSMHQISLMMEETAHVKDAATRLRSPLQATLRATIQQGQQLASQSASAPPAAQPQPASAAQPRPARSGAAAIRCAGGALQANCQCGGSLERGDHPARPEQLQLSRVATIRGPRIESHSAIHRASRVGHCLGHRRHPVAL